MCYNKDIIYIYVKVNNHRTSLNWSRRVKRQYHVCNKQEDDHTYIQDTISFCLLLILLTLDYKIIVIRTVTHLLVKIINVIDILRVYSYHKYNI